MGFEDKMPGIKCLSDFVHGYPSGLFMSPEMQGRVGEGTTEQFQDNAEIYDQRYFEADSKMLTLTKALSLFPHVDPTAFKDILDIGCGSGNTTFPLAEMAPESRIMATDISPQMMAILVKRAEKWGLSDRIAAVVSDAEKVNILPNSFDMIVGSSMVHHLMEPDEFIDKALLTLKLGGIAVFTEPMKSGHIMLRHLLSEIGEIEALRAKIPSNIRTFFTNYIYTIDCMCTLDRSKLDYSKLDDKWMFSRNFFEKCASRNNAELRFFAINPTEERFVGNIERLVWLGLGLEWKLPDPARSFVSRLDASIPLDVMDEFSGEACIVFKKKG